MAADIEVEWYSAYFGIKSLKLQILEKCLLMAWNFPVHHGILITH